MHKTNKYILTFFQRCIYPTFSPEAEWHSGLGLHLILLFTLNITLLTFNQYAIKAKTPTLCIMALRGQMQ